MTINRVQIVSIPVRDQEAAKAFYTDVLGFRVVRDNPMGGGQRWVEVAPPDGPSFTLVTWFAQMPPGSVQGIVLETLDLEATYAELASRGLALSAVEMAMWGTFATFNDPDGNGFVLQQNAAPPGELAI